MREKRGSVNKYFAAIAIVLAVVVLFFTYSRIQSAKTVELAKAERERAEQFNMAMQEASQSYQLRNYSRAESGYRQAIGLEPASYAAHLRLADTLRSMGLYNESLAEYDTALKMPYADYTVHYGKGLAYYLQEDYENAYIQLGTAHRINPNDVAVISYLLNSYIALGLYDEPIRLAKEKSVEEPQNPHYFRKIGLAYFLKNDMNNALKNAEKAVQLDSKYAPNHLTLGNLHISLGMGQEALKDFRAASKLARSNAAFEGISSAYLLLGVPQNQTINANAAAGYPANSFSASVLGFALLNAKKRDMAIAEFNKAIQNKPDYYLPYKGLAKAHLAIGGNEKAREYLLKAAELNKFDREVPEILSSI